MPFTPLEPYSYDGYFVVLTGFYLSFCVKYGKIVSVVVVLDIKKGFYYEDQMAGVFSLPGCLRLEEWKLL